MKSDESEVSMTSYEYDLFVVGAGSGGVRAARMAAANNIRVAVAEQANVGGTCVNLGCIPKKLYVHAAGYGGGFVNAAAFGWQVGTPRFDWQTLRDNKSRVISGGRQNIAKMLENSGAHFIAGRARLVGPHEVEVAGRRYTARHILIATGSRARVQDIPGKQYLLSSDQIFDLDCLPQRMLIVGGGYIASEFAGIFHALGVEVVQIYRGELFLRGFDAEIRNFVAQQMRSKGIDLRFNCDLAKVTKNRSGTFTATLKDGKTLETDLILTAIGRRPNIEGLGIENAGIELTGSGAIKVGNDYQTSAPSVYALGDVIDRIQLTPVALAEAMTFVRNLYLDGNEVLSYDLIPTAIFTQPSIGTVGLSEEAALEVSDTVDIYTTEFRPLQHVMAGNDDKMLMKLVVDGRTDRVMGAHMAGQDAAETIQGIAIALKAGATKRIFDQTVGIHPTSAEEFVTMRTLSRRHG